MNARIIRWHSNLIRVPNIRTKVVRIKEDRLYMPSVIILHDVILLKKKNTTDFFSYKSCNNITKI